MYTNLSANEIMLITDALIDRYKDRVRKASTVYCSADKRNFYLAQAEEIVQLIHALSGIDIDPSDDG